MKPILVTLLLVSLAGNAALAVFAFREKSSALPAVPRTTVAAAGTIASATAPAVTGAANGGAIAPGGWPSLKSGQNLHGLVANLRAAGFPPAVIRAMVSQMVTERLDTSVLEHLPFWKQNGNNPEFLTASQQLSAQHRAMMKELLGAEALPSATMDPSARARRYGNLSDEKVDRIDSITRDYNDLRAKLFAERKPGDFQGSMGSQAAVEQELRAELATVLTPAELEQYEMRSSQSANRLMGNLKGFEVNEAEFTALFRAQKAYDDVDPLRSGVTSPDAMVVRAAAQEELNAQARAVLTDDRFYDYLKGADANYARTAQFTANHPTVTPAMTYNLTQIERDYQSAMMSASRTLSAGGGPPSPERMAQMTAARKDYQDKVTALLGPEIAAAYAQRNRPGATTTIRTGP